MLQLLVGNVSWLQFSNSLIQLYSLHRILKAFHSVIKLNISIVWQLIKHHCDFIMILLDFINIYYVFSPITSDTSHKFIKLIPAILHSVVVRLKIIWNKMIMVNPNVLIKVLRLWSHWKWLDLIMHNLNFIVLLDVTQSFCSSWKLLNFCIRWPTSIASFHVLSIL